MTRTSGVTGPLRWAAISEPLAGQLVSGDRHVVRATERAVWVTVIDGLGHGSEAAHAAAEAAHVMETASLDTVMDALRACHEALARTRGAVMSIVRVTGSELAWVGIGNIETALVRSPSAGASRSRLLVSGGVVGHAMPAARPGTASLVRGDLLILATDGVAPDALERIDVLASPERVVAELMARGSTGRDDALAFAARFDGAQA